MTIDAQGDARRREAADWFARLNRRTVSTEDVKAFSAWRRDPENARTYDRIQAMWEAAATLGENREIAALTEAAKRRGQDVSPASRPRLVGVVGRWGAALGALAVCVFAGWLWWAGQPEIHATAVGEQRTIRLEDGSRITLDTATTIAVRHSATSRRIELKTGQARFDVAPDADRPLTVLAGQTEVTALGTQFDVRRIGTGARVLLVEGRVSVTDRAAATKRWALRPGQQVSTASPRPRVVTADMPVATSWATGRLIFEDTPVAQAIAEVNRYSDTPIVLDDPGIASTRVSGVFDAGDVDGFVAALQALYPLAEDRSRDGRVVLKRDA